MRRLVTGTGGMLGHDTVRTGSRSFPRPAPRPACSALGHARWRVCGGSGTWGDWRSDLYEALPHIRKEMSQ
ncbi:hypothetical protein [Streptomyces sp. NPDC007905]|uniref:hypothetical protein n=1 Tax=Streptomyces sp. NPDC007905 TaxID=3364788 RepID=UPI0036E7A26D